MAPTTRRIGTMLAGELAAMLLAADQASAHAGAEHAHVTTHDNWLAMAGMVAAAAIAYGLSHRGGRRRPGDPRADRPGADPNWAAGQPPVKGRR